MRIAEGLRRAAGRAEDLHDTAAAERRVRDGALRGDSDLGKRSVFKGVRAYISAGIRHIIAVTGDSWNTSLINKPGVYAQIKDYTELNPENF